MAPGFARRGGFAALEFAALEPVRCSRDRHLRRYRAARQRAAWPN